VSLSFASVYRLHDEYERDVYPHIELYDVNDNSYQPDREYRYFLDGQVLNGIPRSSKQHSGTRLQAVVVMQLPSPDKIVLKLEHVRFGKLNRKVLNPRAELPFRMFEPVEMLPEHKEKLHLPFGASYDSGVISRVAFEPADEPWSTNIKRSVLNMLQVNLKSKRSSAELAITNEAVPTEPGTGKSFAVTEKTLEGDCEVTYAITEQPKDISFPVMNVTKAVDLEKCSKRRPVLKYNWRLASECPSCDQKYQAQDKFVKSSTLMKLNISGTPESFLIEAAKTESQYSILLYDEAGSYLNSYVNTTLRLFKTGPKTVELRMPTVESENGLTYSLHWDLWKEKFFAEAEETFLQRSPYSKIPNKPAVIEDLIRKFASMHEEVDGPVALDAPRMFTMIVKLLRMCTLEEVEIVHEKIFGGQPSGLNPGATKLVRDILPNAIGLCGTRSCVKHLIKRIEREEFSAIKSAAALRQLQSVRVANDKTVRDLKELCEKETIKSKFVLKQACYLSLGSLMRSACEPEEDRLALDYESIQARCPVSFKQEFVDYMVSKLKSTEKWESKILYLKALSNAALDLSVFKLEKIIHNIDEFYPAFIRSEAVMSLRHLRSKLPKKVQKICLPVYLNVREPVPVRAACAYLILSSMPERPIVEMVAKQADIDRSSQVASFVFSYLSSLANSTNPCYKKLSHDAKLAMRFTRRINKGLQYSKYVHYSLHSQMSKLGLDIEPFLLFSNRSSVPRNVGLNLNLNALGFFNKDLLTIASAMEGLEPSFARLFGPEGTLYKLYSSYMRHPRNVRDMDYTSEISEIFEKINAVPRRPWETRDKQPKAYMYFRWLGQELGFVPFSSEHYEYMLERGLDHVSDYLRALREGRSFNVHYATILSESEIKIPTSLGLPLLVRNQMPVVMKARGSFKVSTEPEGSIMEARRVMINADIKPSIAMKAVQKVELWSPIVTSGLKIKGIVRAFTPIKAKLDIDYTQSPSQIKLLVEPPTKERELIHLETMPVTYTKVWPASLQKIELPEEKIVHAEEINRVKTIRKSYPGQLIGVGMDVFARYTPKNYNAPRSIPMCPLSGPNTLKIRIMPGDLPPQMIEIKAVSSLLKRKSEPIRSSLLAPLRSFSSESSSSDSVESEEFQEYSAEEHRASEMQIQVSTIGDSQPRKYSVKLSNKFTDDLRHGKLDLKLYSSPIPGYKAEPAEICMKAEIAYPKAPFRMSEIDAKKVVSHAEVTWGPSCDPNNFIQLITSAERSSKQLRFERENMREFHECKSYGEESPIECYEYLKKAGRLSKFEFDIKYNNVPTYVKNVTTKALRALKTYYYWNSDVKHAFSGERFTDEKRIRAVVRVDPADRKRVNATIELPTEIVKFTDIYTPIRINPFNVKRSIFADAKSFISKPRGFEPKCKISSRRLRTFDGKEVSVPLSTCWTVLAKDCSESRRFAVLVKKVSEEAREKVVKILTPAHKIILDGTTPSAIRVRVNGEDYTPEEFSVTEFGSKVAKVYKYGDYVKVHIPREGIWVFFDGRSCEVKISPDYVGRQCGVCGHFDYEPSDEWRTPSMESTSDVSRIFREYTIQSSECSMPEFRCDEPSCTYRPTYRFPESSAEADYKIPRHLSHKPNTPVMKLNKIVRKWNKLCISKEPVEKCPEYAYPSSATTKEVEYGCLEMTDARSSVWSSDALYTPIPEAKSLPTQFTKTETVAASCKRY
jgi:hypothetical protein